MSAKTSHDVSKKMIDWLNSEDGKRELKEALMRADEASNYFRVAILANPNGLNKPFMVEMKG